MHFFEDRVSIDNAVEFLAAMPDSLALAVGQKVPRHHFLAECMESAPLRMGAYAAGLIATGGRRPGEAQAAVISRGLRTAEFSRAVSESLQGVVRRRFDAQARHRAFVSEIEVSRLGVAEPMGNVELASTLSDVTDGDEYQVGRARLSDGETITLFSFGRIADIDRQTIINDDKEILMTSIGGLGATAARHESRLVAEALENNGPLSDGSAVFDPSHGNVITTAFDVGFGPALAALRNQKGDDGLALDYSAAHLVVASDLEYAATKLVHDAGLQIQVTAMASLTAGRYFLAASKEVAQTIAVARLAEAGHPLTVEAAKGAANLDGMSVRVRLEVGSRWIGRKGVVRGGS